MLTEQEQFWKGDFGLDYTTRNANISWRARIPFWRDEIIARTGARSILEAGCNIGTNLKAIRAIDPSITIYGCEINQAAIQEAANAGLYVTEASLFDLKKEWPESGFDLVFTSGVLIHVSSEDISRAMDSIISVSNRYVLAVEYADETEVMVPYRDHNERLWRRPFGKLYEAKGLKLVAEFDAPADAFDRCRAFICEKA
jgi:pseudaminic acid biosynthesis-associated methylase